ncbi:MAG: VWA domain-containing protein, partial [Rhodospirillaceae bacterium]
GRVIGNRDLVLRYELGIDEAVSAGSSYHADERGGFIALQIEPPKLPATELITPREVVFVLDTSGSMAGEPLSASKTFMRAALEGLRPKDHFRIVRFSDAPEQFASTPLPATPENIRAGLRYVATLSAQGGTEMNRAMRTTFDLPPLPNSLRIVIFLTDGFIGEDRQVIQTVSRRIGDARLYAFGIGTAVNRYLLEGMAKEGRGRARIVGIGEQADAVAKALAQSLDAPLLTDITVDWNGLAVGGQSPARIGDLFAGGGVTVLARTPPIAVPQQIFIKGRVNGRPATLPVDLTLAGSEDAESSAPSSALPVVWARERIFDLERDYTLSGGTDATLKEQITQLGLDFSLQTAFT